MCVINLAARRPRLSNLRHTIDINCGWRLRLRRCRNVSAWHARLHIVIGQDAPAARATTLPAGVPIAAIAISHSSAN
jgi:hypothetical protein